MSCSGSVDRVTASGTGQVVRISCCPTPPVQEQELVRRWKQIRRNLFTTVPIPFGVSSFSNIVTDVGIAGPPAPGGDSVSISQAGFTPLPEGPGGGQTRQDAGDPGGWGAD